MSTMLTQLIESEEFRILVLNQIDKELEGSSGKVYDHFDGRLLDGAVTHIEIIDGPIFEVSDREDLKWIIDFSSTARCTVGSLNSNGEDVEQTMDGPCTGSITVSLPPLSVNSSVEDVIGSTQIELDIEEAPTIDKEPDLLD